MPLIPSPSRAVALALVLASPLLAGAIALPAPEARALGPNQIFGIGDQNDPDMFGDPLLVALRPKATRFIADLDTALTPGYARDQMDAWYDAASAAGMRMLIALQQFKGRRPTDAHYQRAFRGFLARYPRVREYAAFNEANHVTQPYYHHPEQAAHIAHVAFLTCPRCTIVPLTLVLGFENYIGYARRFKAALPKRERRRMIWGMSTYSDTNRATDKRMARFVKEFPTGRIWVTEGAAWAQFAAPVWPYDLSRQARMTRFVFAQALRFRSRIQRLYWYEWRNTTDRDVRWDSALVNAYGQPRPAYRVALVQRFRTP